MNNRKRILDLIDKLVDAAREEGFLVIPELKDRIGIHPENKEDGRWQQSVITISYDKGDPDFKEPKGTQWKVTFEG